MELIRIWLAGSKDFNTGVALYDKYGKDTLLKRSFKEKETPFKKSQLIDAMKALLESCRPVIHDDAGNAATSEYLPARSTIRQWNGANLTDQTERALWSKYRLMAKEQADLHSRLELYTTNELRGNAAFRILELDDGMDELIKQRDYYRTNGTLPDQPAIDFETDPFKIAKRMESLTRYIRRERGTIAKDPANVKAAARLLAFTTELGHYKQKTVEHVTD